jgi:acetolactate synthase-1/2/3 large subunit
VNNSELLVGLLEEAGVRWVFGVPSGPVLPFIDALRQSTIRFILTASETSAGFMASTVGCLTDTPGVCVSTVGPGATNLATGVGCAWLDRYPVLAITCNVASFWLDRRIQMRIDHHALMKPLTKASLPLRDEVGSTVTKALAIATEEPPGPVHLDFPEDVAQADAAAITSHARASSPLPDRSGELAPAVAAALQASRRPLMVLGLTFTRCRSASNVLRFIESQRIPFVTTLHAKGSLPESHPNWAGVIGRARRTNIKSFTDQADLVVAVGYDPIEINYEEWVGQRPIIHISTEAAEPGGGLKFLWNEACNVDAAMERISELPLFENRWSLHEWQSHRETMERALRPPLKAFAAHEALDVLREKFPRQGILAYDVGAHTHQIATQWRTDYPKTALATNGWSSMGYGMPAAYAAKLVRPECAVTAVVGDGGFQMTAGEVALARRLGLAVPVIVLNDGWLTLMKVKQERKHYPLSGVYLGPPPDSPAHYFGVPCRSAGSVETFAAALDWAFTLGGPSVIEAFIEAESYGSTVFD